MRQVPKHMQHFWIKVGSDTSSRRLRQTWEWLDANHAMHMPDEVSVDHLSSGLVRFDGDQTIATFLEDINPYSLVPVEDGYPQQFNARFYLTNNNLSDGGSIPRTPRWILNVQSKGKYALAFYWHDELTNDSSSANESIHFYLEGKHRATHVPAQHSWNWKAELMYYALRYLGCGHVRAYIMYLAVVWHGKRKGL